MRICCHFKKRRGVRFIRSGQMARYEFVLFTYLDENLTAEYRHN